MRRKRLFIVVILCALYVPLFLAAVSSICGIKCDVKLSGYTDQIEKPVMSFVGVWDGDYQKQYSKWSEQELIPRGVLTRTYNSVQYFLSGQVGTIIVGKNGDLFSRDYIDGELCTNGAPNYVEENQRKKMQDYVDRLVILNDKLKANGKELIVYIAPSKAYFDFENLPQKFIGVMPEERKNAAECFSELISQTSIPYIICRDYKGSLDFPLFYRSGIHWSPLFEQYIRTELINLLTRENRPYRNCKLTQIQESNSPFGGEKDYFNLLNVWWEGTNEKYLLYNEKQEEKDEFSRLRILIQGTSFSDGLRYNMQKAMPLDDIYYINRKDFYIDRDGNQQYFNDWDQLDFDYLINHSDIICIESTEHELYQESYGFVDYLIDYMEDYQKETKETEYLQRFEAGITWNEHSLRGIYRENSDYNWTKREFYTILENKGIYDQGLQMDFMIPNEELIDHSSVSIQIWINGEKNYQTEFYEGGHKHICIEPEQIALHDNKTIDIEVHTSESFVPKEHGMGEDTRELGLALYYLGEKKE